MREPKLYLSLIIIEGDAGYFRTLLDLTTLIACYFIIKSVVLASKMYVAETIRTKLHGLRRGLSDGLAMALGINKIQFVAGMG